MPSALKLYKDTALILLNTVVVLLVINIVLGAIYFVYDCYNARTKANQVGAFVENGSPTDNGKRSAYQLEWFDYNATTEVTREHASEVLDDFYALGQQGFIYQPWVQFSEPQFAGKHLSVDIDSHGFPHRRTANPQFVTSNSIIDVFVLGGSTTFGYNVADEHTWPSYLSTILNEKVGDGLQVRVTNYGRGYYDPSQELALITHLLKSGYRPRLVLFMDGVNLGGTEDVPAFTPLVSQAMENAQHGREKISPGMKQWLRNWIPLVRLVLSIKTTVYSPQDADRIGLKQENVAPIVDRFHQNRRITQGICEQYGAKSLFFLQPDAAYNYPAQLYRRTLPANFLESRNIRQAFYAQLGQNADVIDLRGLFDEFGAGQGRKAIVDDLHYSPNFNKFLAERVAAHIDLMKLKNVETPVR